MITEYPNGISVPDYVTDSYWWKKVKEYDKYLFLKWNSEIKRLELWRMGKLRPIPMMMVIDGIMQDTNLIWLGRRPIKVITIQDEHNEPMPVDRRLYEYLRMNDIMNWKSVTHYSNEQLDMENRTKAKQQKNLGEELTWIGNDVRRSVARDL